MRSSELRAGAARTRFHINPKICKDFPLIAIQYLLSITKKAPSSAGTTAPWFHPNSAYDTLFVSIVKYSCP